MRRRTDISRLALTLAVMGALVVVEGCGTRGMRRRPGSDIVVPEGPRITDVAGRPRCQSAPDEGRGGAIARACRDVPTDTVPRRPSDSETGQPPRKTP